MKSIPSKYDSQYSSYDYYAFVYIQQGIKQTTGLDFLAWNRAFLYQFEQELQATLNDNSFRLLFWDLTNKLSTDLCLYDESFVGGNGIYINSSSSLSCNKWQIDQRLTAETKLKNYTCLLRNIAGNRTYDKLPDTEYWVNILSQDYNIYDRDWQETAFAIKQYINRYKTR